MEKSKTNTLSFQIYQAKPEIPHWMSPTFFSYQYSISQGIIIKKEYFNMVYEGAFPVEDENAAHLPLLDKLYYIFNCQHPADYKGHSLSMGDVIVLGNDVKSAYYVDTVGFQLLDSF